VKGLLSNDSATASIGNTQFNAVGKFVMAK